MTKEYVVVKKQRRFTEGLKQSKTTETEYEQEAKVIVAVHRGDNTKTVLTITTNDDEMVNKIHIRDILTLNRIAGQERLAVKEKVTA